MGRHKPPSTQIGCPFLTCVISVYSSILGVINMFLHLPASLLPGSFPLPLFLFFPFFLPPSLSLFLFLFPSLPLLLLSPSHPLFSSRWRRNTTGLRGTYRPVAAAMCAPNNAPPLNASLGFGVDGVELRCVDGRAVCVCVCVCVCV